MRELELILSLLCFWVTTAGCAFSLLSPKGVNFEGELHIAPLLCFVFSFFFPVFPFHLHAFYFL